MTYKLLLFKQCADNRIAWTFTGLNCNTEIKTGTQALALLHYFTESVWIFWLYDQAEGPRPDRGRRAFLPLSIALSCQSPLPNVEQTFPCQWQGLSTFYSENKQDFAGQFSSEGLLQGAPGAPPHHLLPRLPSGVWGAAARAAGQGSGAGHTHGGGSPQAEALPVPGSAPAKGVPHPRTCCRGCARPEPPSCWRDLSPPAPRPGLWGWGELRMLTVHPGMNTEGMRRNSLKGCLHYTACLPTAPSYSAALS